MDLMSIQPLVLTEINWPTFIKTSKDFLGYSPTRGLDDTKIDLKEPRAFLGALDCENNPHEALRRAAVKNILRHSFASFIMVIDDADLIINLGIRDTLAVHVVKEGSRFLTILSGTMWDWYHAMIIYCQRDSNRTLRQIFNIIYEFFKQMKLTPIWSHYKDKYLQDDTFALEPK